MLWSVQVCSRSPSANANGSPRCQRRGNQIGLLRHWSISPVMASKLASAPARLSDWKGWLSQP